MEEKDLELEDTILNSTKMEFKVLMEVTILLEQNSVPNSVTMEHAILHSVMIEEDKDRGIRYVLKKG